MAYDEALAEKIRESIGVRPGLSEKKMFGGLAFLINGNMAVAASGQGGMMIRADPGKAAEFVKDGAQPMVMRGRQMKGWLRVEAPKSGLELTKWVKVGVGFASSLPPK